MLKTLIKRCLSFNTVLEGGVEPPRTASEAAVLPLDDSRILKNSKI